MFDYVSFLKGGRMIGPIHPWKRDDGEIFDALLVPVDNALAECNGWANQEMSRAEFLTYLKINDILVFGNIDDFVEWKKEKAKPSDKKKFKRVISEERRNQLRNHAKTMREKIRPTISQNA